MRHLFVTAACAAVALALACAPASAQTVTRLCVNVPNASAAPNCVESWSPQLLHALAATVTQVKGAAGLLGSIYCYNPNATVGYVQIFDAASTGAVTLGTTAPKLSIGIPATSGNGIPLSAIGITFLTGIQVAATTTATGSTGVSTGLECNAMYD